MILRMRLSIPLLFSLFAASSTLGWAQETRLAVVAFDAKTGEPILNLTAANFAVEDGDTKLRVEAAEYSQKALDVMLVVDTSLIGNSVRPLVLPMINGLAEGDQMALVGYDQSATLLQDFTSSKDLLRKGLLTARYEGNPRGIDAQDGARRRVPARTSPLGANLLRLHGRRGLVDV